MKINQASIRSLVTFFCLLLAIATAAMSSTALAAKPDTLTHPATKVSTVSVNTASAEAIANAMKGVGIKKAQAIVEWRKANGRFTSLEQLMEIKGIGKKTLEANKNRIKL